MSKRKILAIVLVLAMVLALPVVAMADDLPKPVATTTTTQPSTIQSVTIGGVTASYQIDGYGNPSSPTFDNSQVFIRATLPATSAEEELKSADISITMSTGSTISGGSLINTYSDDYEYDASTRTYDFTGVNMLNNAYTITIGNNTYIIAAGLNDSNKAHVAIPTTDPLFISNFAYDGTNATVYRVTVQNPCMGNPYFVGNNNSGTNGWTFINYYIKAINVETNNTSAVPITFTKDADATVSGDVTVVSGSTFANVSGSAPVLTVTNNGYSRSYNMVARIKTSNNIWVVYGFNFDELKAETDYYYNGSTVKTKADQIEAAAIAYFNPTEEEPQGEISVPVGSTAMYVVQEFMRVSGYSEYDPDSTYISSINGLAAFDTTGLDGWMYTDDPDGWDANCGVANVGAADYVLSAGDTITWFFTTNFLNHMSW